MLDKTCIKTQIENLNFDFQWYTFKPFYQEWFDQSNSRSVYFFSFSLAGKYWMLLLFWNLGCPIWYPLLFRVNYIPLKGKEREIFMNEQIERINFCFLFYFMHYINCADGCNEIPPKSVHLYSSIIRKTCIYWIEHVYVILNIMFAMNTN